MDNVNTIEVKPKQSTKIALTEKEQKFAQGMERGLSCYRAALEAGYSDASARSASAQILPKIQRIEGTLANALRSRTTMGHLAGKLLEGLGATRTERAQFRGSFTDERESTDYAERRNAVLAIAKLLGEEGAGDVSQTISIKIEDMSARRLPIPTTGRVIDAAPIDESITISDSSVTNK
jgi:hypothetical protein